ncbi:hypothetical protein [uncultured Serinicoccus sp.]|uniref:hypothetical protein n=1 Tax=uncultured Serinicoccus sp. TaxID=735514 RepID=UPI00261324DC|nr:hypothetical protein [uncultured Serinicoccus sp.]
MPFSAYSGWCSTKPKPVPSPRVVVEVVHELVADVEVGGVVPGLLVHHVEHLVHVRDRQPAGAVRHLVQVGDAVVPDEPLVAGRRGGRGLRELDELLHLDAEDGGLGVGQRVQQRLLGDLPGLAVGGVAARDGEVLPRGVDAHVVEVEVTRAARAVDPEEAVQGPGDRCAEVELLLGAVGQAGLLLVGAALAVDGDLVGVVVGDDPHALPGVLAPDADGLERPSVAGAQDVVVLVVHVGPAVGVGAGHVDVGDPEGGVDRLRAQEPEEQRAGVTLLDGRDLPVGLLAGSVEPADEVVLVERVLHHRGGRRTHPAVLAVERAGGVGLEVEQGGEVRRLLVRPAGLLRGRLDRQGGRCEAGDTDRRREREGCPSPGPEWSEP